MVEVLEFSGSHYEMGVQMGGVLERGAGEGYPPGFSGEVLGRARPWEDVMREHTPGLLDEFRGISDRLGIDNMVQLALEGSPYRFDYGNCMVMVVSGEHTADGLPLLARNHEWVEEEGENLRVVYAEPEKKLRSMGFTFHWPLVSRYGGVNEAGLAISSASASFENMGPGVMLNIATRWVLDNCRSTGEAVEFLEGMPKTWGETYVMIDAENVIGKVESHRRKTVVSFSETGFEMNTLIYDSPEMQGCMSRDRVESLGKHASARRRYLEGWFQENKGEITVDMIKDALRNHEHDVCYHGSSGLEICWSYVLQVGGENTFVVPGRPCKGKYEKIPIRPLG